MLQQIWNGITSLGSRFGQLPLLHRGIVVLFLVGLPCALLYMYHPSATLMLGFVAVVVGVAILLFLVGRLWKAHEKKKNAELDNALKSAFEEIHGELGEALDELKRLDHKVYSLPWFMWLGEPRGGKTTTLVQSGLDFPLGKHRIKGTGGTRNCEWVFTSDAIVLDTAGRFVFEDHKAPDAQEWDEFLRLIKKHRPRCPINGVIIGIPCMSSAEGGDGGLLEDSEDEVKRKAAIIRDKLSHLRRELEIQFPVFIMVLKADRILGFEEFFSTLPVREQSQMFGWSKPDPYDTPMEEGDWPKIFSDMKGQLNKWRRHLLEQDVESTNNSGTYCFPEEFAGLEAPLTTYLTEIFGENRLLGDPLYFRGIYFSSGVQKGGPVARACREFTSPGVGATPGPFQERQVGYFIKDFYSEKVFKEQGLVRPTSRALKTRRRLERVTYGVGGVLLLLVLVLCSLSWYSQYDGQKQLVDDLRGYAEAEGADAETVRRAHADKFAEKLDLDVYDSETQQLLVEAHVVTSRQTWLSDFDRSVLRRLAASWPLVEPTAGDATAAGSASADLVGGWAEYTKRRDALSAYRRCQEPQSAEQSLADVKALAQFTGDGAVSAKLEKLLEQCAQAGAPNLAGRGVFVTAAPKAELTTALKHLDTFWQRLIDGQFPFSRSRQQYVKAGWPERALDFGLWNRITHLNGRLNEADRALASAIPVTTLAGVEASLEQWKQWRGSFRAAAKELKQLIDEELSLQPYDRENGVIHLVRRDFDNDWQALGNPETPAANNFAVMEGRFTRELSTAALRFMTIQGGDDRKKVTLKAAFEERRDVGKICDEALDLGAPFASDQPWSPEFPGVLEQVGATVAALGKRAERPAPGYIDAVRLHGEVLTTRQVKQFCDRLQEHEDQPSGFADEFARDMSEKSIPIGKAAVTISPGFLPAVGDQLLVAVGKSIAFLRASKGVLEVDDWNARAARQRLEVFQGAYPDLRATAWSRAQSEFERAVTLLDADSWAQFAEQFSGFPGLVSRYRDLMTATQVPSTNSAEVASGDGLGQPTGARHKEDVEERAYQDVTGQIRKMLGARASDPAFYEKLAGVPYPRWLEQLNAPDSSASGQGTIPARVARKAQELWQREFEALCSSRWQDHVDKYLTDNSLKGRYPFGDGASVSQSDLAAVARLIEAEVASLNKFADSAKFPVGLQFPKGVLSAMTGVAAWSAFVKNSCPVEMVVGYRPDRVDKAELSSSIATEAEVMVGSAVHQLYVGDSGGAQQDYTWKFRKDGKFSTFQRINEKNLAETEWPAAEYRQGWLCLMRAIEQYKFDDGDDDGRRRWVLEQEVTLPQTSGTRRMFYELKLGTALPKVIVLP